MSKVTFADHLHNRDGAKWQLIFRTEEGLDYCRETLEGSDKDKIEKIAADLLEKHSQYVATVHIERW